MRYVTYEFHFGQWLFRVQHPFEKVSFLLVLVKVTAKIMVKNVFLAQPPPFSILNVTLIINFVNEMRA